MIVIKSSTYFENSTYYDILVRHITKNSMSVKQTKNTTFSNNQVFSRFRLFVRPTSRGYALFDPKTKNVKEIIIEKF